MKTEKKIEHTHKYQKTLWGHKGTIIWKCMIPGCSHYLHIEFILGKPSRCWKCDKEFVMSYAKLLRQKPKCDKCQHTSGQGRGRRKEVEQPLQQPTAVSPAKKGEPSIPDLANINIDELLENL